MKKAIAAVVIALGGVALLTRKASASEPDGPSVETYEERRHLAIYCTTDTEYMASVAAEARRRGDEKWAAVIDVGIQRYRTMTPEQLEQVKRDMAASGECGQAPVNL